MPRCLGAGIGPGPDLGIRENLMPQGPKKSWVWGRERAGLGYHCLALTWGVLQIGQIGWAEEFRRC